MAPDFTRSVLIVPAMNYSLLLTRSIDFDPFAQVLYPAYPDELIAAAAAVADRRRSGIAATRTATPGT